MEPLDRKSFQDATDYTGSVYQDRGCVFAPTCLECPLPKCTEEMTERERSSAYEARRRQTQREARAGR